MEKVMEFWVFFKRHHFWFIAGIVTVVAMLAGWMANSALDAKFVSEKGQIESATSAVRGIPSSKHPNAVSEEEMKKLNLLRRQEVEAAWNAMYAQQRTSILTWPQDLTKEFRDEVKNSVGDDPIEKIDLVANTRRDIPTHLRQEYRDYIESELPKLAEEIGAKWKAGMMGGENPQPGLPMEKEPMVLWNPTNQTALLTRFTWANAPTTHQVLYAQEDLWVLTALLQVIKRTNGATKERHKAAIREIDSIQIGQDVHGRVGAVTRLAPPVVDPNAPPMPMGVQQPPPLAAPIDPLAAAKVAADPASNRYVNLNYEPLTGEALKTAVNSEAAADAYAAVAKRMPIRIRVKMDTRKINRLLAECGNSDLPVEIRQVRIGCEAGAAGGGQNIPGAFPQGPPPRGLGGEGHGPPRPPVPMPFAGPRPAQPNLGGEGNAADLEQFPYDRYVELYGIIYIFNPVNKKQLFYSEEELAALRAAAPGAVPGPGTTPMGTAPMGTTPMGTTPMGAPIGPAPMVPAPMPMPAPVGPAPVGPAPMPMPAPVGPAPAPVPMNPPLPAPDPMPAPMPAPMGAPAKM